MNPAPDIAPAPRRVLPHSLEAERAVLGGVLLRQQALAFVAPHVAPADFYHPAHQAIYSAMRALDDDGTPIDPLTVCERLAADGNLGKLRAVNGEAYFTDLLDGVVTVENIAFHAQMVKGKATVRRLIEACSEIAAQAHGQYGDLDAFIADAERRIMEITTAQAAGRLSPLRDVIRDEYAEIEAQSERPDEGVTGIVSGFVEIDERTSGFQPGEFIVIAGRPAMGKSALAMDMVIAAATAGTPCLVFSLEMKNKSLARRILAKLGRVNLRHIKRAAFTNDEWRSLIRARTQAMGLPVTLVDSDDVSITQLRALARRWRMEVDADKKTAGKVGLVVLDYLQLLEDDSKPEFRQQVVAKQTRSLKKLAGAINSAVIALSQLNRGLESRADKRPMLSDLRESGAIEQDADIVAFTYRDEVYNPNSADAGIAEIIFGKQRDGATGTVRLAWDGATATFRALNDKPFLPSLGRNEDGQ